MKNQRYLRKCQNSIFVFWREDTFVDLIECLFSPKHPLERLRGAVADYVEFFIDRFVDGWMQSIANDHMRGS
jgi:hypothetical protein